MIVIVRLFYFSALAIDTVVCPRGQMDFSNRDFCGAMLQYPDTTGNVYDYSTIVDSAHTNGVSSISFTRGILFWIYWKQIIHLCRDHSGICG